MSPQAKKTTWYSAAMITLIFTAISVAYTAGLKTSAAASKIKDVDTRVTAVANEVVQNSDNFLNHQISQEKTQIENKVDHNQIKAQLNDFGMKQVKVLTTQDVFSEDIAEIKAGVKELNQKIP